MSFSQFLIEALPNLKLLVYLEIKYWYIHVGDLDIVVRYLWWQKYGILPHLVPESHLNGWIFNAFINFNSYEIALQSIEFRVQSYERFSDYSSQIEFFKKTYPHLCCTIPEPSGPVFPFILAIIIMLIKNS